MLDSMMYVLALGGGVFIVGLLLGAWLGYQFLAERKVRQVQASARKELEKSVQAERARFRSVSGLISRMSGTLIYNRVLEMAQDVGVEALSAFDPAAEKMVSAAFLFFQDGDRTQLRVGPSRRMTVTDQRLSIPGEKGVLAQAIDSGEGTLIKDLAEDPELGVRFISLSGCKSAYCLPLRAGLNVYGGLLFAHPESDFFRSTQRDILDILGQQAISALQNASLYNDLEQEKERMLQIQEDARKKLARDLHDGPTQSVAAIVMRVNFTRRLMEKNLPAAAVELVKIEEMARRTTKEIRLMLFTLRPLILESEGLEAALQAMADKMRETFDQNVIIQVDANLVADMEMNKQTVVFYIAEEAANNARKHAQAAHIWVSLRQLETGLAVLEIKDDGVGFNTGLVDESYDRRGSLGMINMRERTELVNGRLRISSVEGQGTTIQVAIPLSEDAEDRLRHGG